MIRRRGSRSTQAPTGRPMTTQGTQAAATIALIANTPACRTRIATSRIASSLTVLPRKLVVSPVHSSRKSRVASSPSLGLMAPVSFPWLQ